LNHFVLQKRSQNNKSESTLLEQYLKDDQEMDPNQKFLRDYVIFEGWKEGNKMPQSGKEGYDVEPMNEEEEEAYLNESNKFEALYNFR
jgi:pantothenate kinase-related protein Tda10